MWIKQGAMARHNPLPIKKPAFLDGMPAGGETGTPD
jgi:hypothetical protein